MFDFLRPTALAFVSSFALVAVANAQTGATGSVTITQPVGSDGTSIASTEPLVIHDPYLEEAHFMIRRLALEGQGPTIHVQPGTVVHARAEVNVHCVHCATPHNHIIIGYSTERAGATCVWSGLRESGGWHHKEFTLVAPAQPGVYPIRVAIASSGLQVCGDHTLSYWTHERPTGPAPDATIGVLVVENPQRVVTPTTTDLATQTAAATAASAATPGSTAITNGSFEFPDVANGSTQVIAALPGWVRMGGQGIEIHDNNAGRGATGTQFIELDGMDSSAIATDLPTTVGSSYLITLQFAARPGTAAGDNKLEVRWNGELVAVVQASGEGQTDTRWSRYSFRVRAAGTGSRLELRDAGQSNGQGTYVDDVSIQPIQ